MSTRTRIVSAGLLAIVCGGAHAQPTLPPPGTPPALVFSTPPADVRGGVIAVPVPPVPHVKSVDDLLNELDNLRAQKAELEKKEQELTAALRKKLDAQAERLKKLGVAPPGAEVPEPNRVGRIIIEGNIKTPDREIHDKLDFRPGQVLQYPKLEAARAALEKAGFRGVTVEAIPDEIGSPFLDIRVRVNESKP